MNRSVDITDRKELRSLLLSLDAGTSPIWGKMKARQMVEHLVDQVQWTNGKKITTCDRPAEEAYQAKQIMIYTNTEIPKNIFLEELPENYLYASIEAAVDQLMLELADFDTYFKEPGIVSIHAGFGPMNYEEWVKWHSKHFTHHLKQFKLL